MFISSLKEGKLSVEYLLGSTAANIHILKKKHLLVETRTEISDDAGLGI